MLPQVTGFPSFSRLSHIPFYADTTLCVDGLLRCFHFLGPVSNAVMSMVHWLPPVNSWLGGSELWVTVDLDCSSGPEFEGAL
jgi:hypothetical protein